MSSYSAPQVPGASEPCAPSPPEGSRSGDAPRYVAWRCADLAAFRNANERKGGKPRNGQPFVSLNPWREATCSACGEPVWHQPDNAEGRVLVCWPCAESDA